MVNWMWTANGATVWICAKKSKAFHMQVEETALRIETIWTSMIQMSSRIPYGQRLYEEPCGSLLYILQTYHYIMMAIIYEKTSSFGNDQ